MYLQFIQRFNSGVRVVHSVLYIIPCCNFGYDFCIRRCWVSRYPRLFVICIMSYLRYLYLFTYILDYVSTKKGVFPEATILTLCEHLGSSPFCLFSLLLLCFLLLLLLFIYLFFLVGPFCSPFLYCVAFFLLFFSAFCVLCPVLPVWIPHYSIGFLYLLFIMHYLSKTKMSIKSHWHLYWWCYVNE